MLTVRYDRPDEMVAWASERLGGSRDSSVVAAIGQERDGRLVAVALFDHFLPGVDCEWSFASDGSHRFVTRTFMRLVAAYPFRQLGLQRVSAEIAVTNQPAIDIALRLGFVLEGRKRHPDPERERLVLGLLRSECRWAPPLNLMGT